MTMRQHHDTDDAINTERRIPTTSPIDCIFQSPTPMYPLTRRNPLMRTQAITFRWFCTECNKTHTHTVTSGNLDDVLEALFLIAPLAENLDIEGMMDDEAAAVMDLAVTMLGGIPTESATHLN